jgi:hypothetical protein
MNTTEKTLIQHPGEAFIIYVRTLQFMKTRLRGLDDQAAVFIQQDDIETHFFPFPKYNLKAELQKLIESGQLRMTESHSPQTGRKMFWYEALLPGKRNLYLLYPKAVKLDADTLQMRDNLKRVTQPPDVPSTEYFNAFLRFRHDLLPIFFKVDDFSGRVHTPVSGFHREYRPYLLIDGQLTCSIDVCTMQPLLLSKVLKEQIGCNEFSEWIEAGEDVYVKLQGKAALQTRDAGKDRFFEILFSQPSNSLADLFGESSWINWINTYKQSIEPRNPHLYKRHSNLAWLLQTAEVGIMRKVWRALNASGVPFLSVHDEIICKQSHLKHAVKIMHEALSSKLTAFKLKIDCQGTTTISESVPNRAVPDVTISKAEVTESINIGAPETRPATEKGYGFVGNSGQYYKRIPFGRIEVYKSLSSFKNRFPPINTLSSAEWMKIKFEERVVVENEQNIQEKGDQRQFLSVASPE